MANHSDAVEGNADSPQRPHAWALILLLGFAAALAIPDLFDAGIVKRAATALLAALVILPLLAAKFISISKCLTTLEANFAFSLQ